MQIKHFIAWSPAVATKKSRSDGYTDVSV